MIGLVKVVGATASRAVRYPSVVDASNDKRPDEGCPHAVTILAAVVSDPVFGVDLDGVVDVWNPAAERLWRIPAADAIGSRLPQFAPSRRRRFLAAVRRVAGTVEPGAVSESTQRIGEGPVACSFVLVPLPEGGDGRGRVLAVVSDAEVRWRVEELVTSVPGSVSERLRTPLAAVLGYSQLLARPEGVGDRARRAQASRGVAVRGQDVMAALEDLSMLERIVSGRPPLDPRAADPAGLIAEAVSAAETTALGCRFIAELDNKAGTVDVDRRVMRYVIDGALVRAATDRPSETDVRVRLTRTGMVATITIDSTSETAIQRPGVDSTDLGSVVMSRVAEAHGGAAEESRLPEGGRTTILRLPLRTEV